MIRRIPTADLRKTFDEMELTLDVASEICSSCGAVNLFPGFSKMDVFTCKSCGEVTRVSDDRTSSTSSVGEAAERGPSCLLDRTRIRGLHLTMTSVKPRVNVGFKLSDHCTIIFIDLVQFAF